MMGVPLWSQPQADALPGCSGLIIARRPPFGSPAASSPEARGFASPPRDGFALVELAHTYNAQIFQNAHLPGGQLFGRGPYTLSLRAGVPALPRGKGKGDVALIDAGVDTDVTGCEKVTQFT